MIRQHCVVAANGGTGDRIGFVGEPLPSPSSFCTPFAPATRFTGRLRQLTVRNNLGQSLLFSGLILQLQPEGQPGPQCLYKVPAMTLPVVEAAGPNRCFLNTEFESF